MNKIEQMVKEMCPGGVRCVKLETLLDYKQPTPYIVKSTEYCDTYPIPVLTAGQTFVLGFTNETFGIFKASKNNPTIIFDDFTTSFHWVDFDFKVKSSAMKMLTPKTNNSFRYIYYAMSCIGFVPTEHSRHWISKYSQFEIPLPPLPIQEAIVEILDKFESLQQGLQDELQARKKQYEYYRNKLINNKSEYVQYQLCDIALLKAGKAIRASELSAAPDSTHPYPCYGGNGIRGYIGYYSHEGEYSIIGRQGALCGCINYAIGRFYATEHAVVCTPSEKVDTRFLYHLLSYSNLNQYKSQGAQPGLAVSKLNELLFKIPGISEQTRIASFLDHFETLVNDQEKGIPAEISAVKKQYEYYRNKLLTFSTQNYKE